MEFLAAATDLVAAAGLVQGAFSLALARRFTRSPAAVPRVRPPVTVLKPLHGDEPLLEHALASLCIQDYPALQLVFGVQDPADLALHTVDRLRARYPALDVSVVVNAAQHGLNRKVSNLINMYPVAKHDLIVIADSDIHAEPGYLDQLVAALETPGVGLVTTLYTGLRSNESLVARLGAAGINHGFLPGNLMARWLGRQDCLGATMALRRETLEQVGGFASLVSHLADDAVLGRRVRALGASVALAGTVAATTVPESAMRALFNHELRWARTTQKLEPVGYALSAMQHPLAWATLAVVLAADAPWAWLMLLLTWWLRWLTTRGIERVLGLDSGLAAWCLPVRDLLSMAVLLASYGGDRVAWRGHILHVDAPALLRKKGWTIL
ncbi:MAG: bacteriohopanetetrol glucosamine biosynthesis glycosyltransferase HpnI [Acetobacteraceae bacterium]|nr:bacteriohopanetetrol glucosamine biosynthesis glycosyltransferase HpnI [Acetobacteraceae bacterium]